LSLGTKMRKSFGETVVTEGREKEKY
jgi:hypothetical protein